MGKADTRKTKHVGLSDNIFRLYKHNFTLYFKITTVFFLIPILPVYITQALQKYSKISGKPLVIIFISTNLIPKLLEKQEVKIL